MVSFYPVLPRSDAQVDVGNRGLSKSGKQTFDKLANHGDNGSVQSDAYRTTELLVRNAVGHSS